MQFHEILRHLIEERGMTQKELALRFNLSPSTLGSYVQGTREPDFETLKRLAAYFGTTTDYLLDCHSSKAESFQEEDLLRVFRSLGPEDQKICLEQCRVLLKHRSVSVQ